MSGLNLSEFATHVFHGTRFRGVIPVEVLPELAAYREFVLEVARALYREAEGRQRVSKGFESSFQLVLREEVGEGSAVLKLERVVTEAPERQLALVPTPPAPDYFEQARELIAQTISEVGQGGRPPREFPSHLLALFNSLGRTLLDDESIELKGSRKVASVKYDRNTRKRLVLLRSPTYEDQVDVVGEVVQFDRQRMTFDLLVGDTRVPGRLDGLDDESVRTVYTAGAVGRELQVRVTGVGAMDAGERLTKWVHVERVQYAENEALKEQLDIEKRLGELGDLAEGWFDGTGTAFRPQDLAWVADTLKRAEGSGLPRPYLYPTPEGHVQAEWSFLGAEVSAEIFPQAREAHLVGVHTKTGASADRVVPLSSARGLADLVSFVNLYAP
jgi:hypothetical protein